VNEEFDRLPALYKTLSKAANIDHSYVYFCLNYQPENTTSPLGGVFNDQSLAIALIANNLPSDWKIYVKEHPGQFIKIGAYGYIGRDEQFYRRLAMLPNVSFVPIDSDHFSMLDNSRCVATITGTVGWEALVRGKPVMVFGEAWYQDAPNVYRIRNSADCRNALMKIFDSPKTDEEGLIKYINAVIASSIDIDFEEYEARWDGRTFDFEANCEKLYNVLESEITRKQLG
jgi:hypothetical protein